MRTSSHKIALSEIDELPKYRLDGLPATPTGGRTSQRSEDGAYAGDVLKIAGRLNAAASSDDEYKELITERDILLAKKYDLTASILGEGLSRKEDGRLRFVEWKLDKIDDARTGRKIDLLEEKAKAYRDAVSMVNSLRSQLSQFLPQKRF